MAMGSTSSSSSCCSRFWSSALRSKRLVSPAEKAARDSSARGLSRRLGVFDLILLGIGASIGAGIFVVTGTVARDTGPGINCLRLKFFLLLLKMEFFNLFITVIIIFLLKSSLIYVNWSIYFNYFILFF
jgi:amino acid permease